MKIQTVIHPSAVIETGAQIGAGVQIGPFCHVSADAVIGDNVKLIGHV
jgi:UDP-N-acetylglucosamine acyltransferase